MIHSPTAHLVPTVVIEVVSRVHVRGLSSVGALRVSANLNLQDLQRRPKVREEQVVEDAAPCGPVCVCVRVCVCVCVCAFCRCNCTSMREPTRACRHVHATSELQELVEPVHHASIHVAFHSQHTSCTVV